MTEPVARAASPRRTVRVAAALVAGQAALCAVIGWVTFGAGGESAPPAASGQVGPMAVPPIAAPSISLALPSPAAAPSTPAATSQTWRSTRPPKPPPRTAPPRTRTTTTATLPPTTLATTPTVPAPAPPSPELVASLTPSPPPVQVDVVVGEPCDPQGALGLTDDDVEVHCVRGDDGPPSWQIN